jgi:hypothetical protein
MITFFKKKSYTNLATDQMSGHPNSMFGSPTGRVTVTPGFQNEPSVTYMYARI